MSPPVATTPGQVGSRSPNRRISPGSSPIHRITPFAQELCHARPLRDWTYGDSLPIPDNAARTPDYESERPLTLVLPNGLVVALGEARLVEYARMKFILSQKKNNTIAASLFEPVTQSSPFQTPWRVIMVAGRAGASIEGNDIFLNLNASCEVKDAAWIMPGKIMREVTLSTAGAKERVDFCAKHRIQYIEFDAGWYGYEYSEIPERILTFRRSLTTPGSTVSGCFSMSTTMNSARPVSAKPVRTSSRRKGSAATNACRKQIKTRFFPLRGSSLARRITPFATTTKRYQDHIGTSAGAVGHFLQPAAIHVLVRQTVRL